MCEMASLFEKRLKCVGNDVDLWEMGKKHMANAQNMSEMA